MKYLVLFVDNFEDVEGVAPIDVLTRGGEEVVCASLMGRNQVTTKVGHGLILKNKIEDIDYKDFDCLIIPGGPGSFRIMPDLPIVNELINYFANNNKVVASICAAPHLVGKLGYFQNKNYTVHPGFEEQVIGGNYLRDQGVVEDGNFITAKSMYYSIAFALKIYEHFHGVNARIALENSLMGEK